MPIFAKRNASPLYKKINSPYLLLAAAGLTFDGVVVICKEVKKLKLSLWVTKSNKLINPTRRGC